VTGLKIETAAKVNLGLRVLGRRPDGYHEVETVLQTVGVWDTVGLHDEKDGTVGVRASPADAPQGEENLCWQAAHILARHMNVRRGVSIVVEKTIPMRSGLGGGSSDAAAALSGLVRLWNLDISPDDLGTIAAEVGSDVPFFLPGGTRLARGRGERLTPCPELAAWLVVIVPEQRVPTAQAYAALGRGVTRGRRRGPSRPVQRLVEALGAGDLAGVSGSLHNDFEKARLRGVADALRAKEDLLAAGCLGATMSGSGSAVFGIAADQAEAERIAFAMQEKWPWVRPAPTVPSGGHMRIAELEAG
jgi:4-diphosphocytidyl-2-C-methyl-D-erythritol kinase